MFDMRRRRHLRAIFENRFNRFFATSLFATWIITATISELDDYFPPAIIQEHDIKTYSKICIL